MARMEMDLQNELFRINVFQIIKFSLEILEILKNCCCFLSSVIP